MNYHMAPTYIPLATDRTKSVVRHMQLGAHYVIDIVNTIDPDDRREADAWVSMDERGAHFRYSQGGRSGDMEWDFGDLLQLAPDAPA